jgi:hypothetical protein
MAHQAHRRTQVWTLSAAWRTLHQSSHQQHQTQHQPVPQQRLRPARLCLTMTWHRSLQALAALAASAPAVLVRRPSRGKQPGMMQTPATAATASASQALETGATATAPLLPQLQAPAATTGLSTILLTVATASAPSGAGATATAPAVQLLQPPQRLSQWACLTAASPGRTAV